MFQRNLQPSLLAALTDTPVVFVDGPRQAGKSTLARAVIGPEYPATYLTLDDVLVRRAAIEDPSGFVAGMRGPVVLDEVQRAGAEIFLAIKAEVDRDRRPGRFLLTGSTDALLRPSIASALVGRVEVLTLLPLSVGEMSGLREGFIDALFGQGFASGPENADSREALLDRIIAGGFPEALRRTGRRRDDWFRSYVTTVVERDVSDLAGIGRLASLAQLLPLLATRSAQLLNLSDLSRNAGIPLSTMQRYFSHLQTSFLVNALPAWSSNIGKRLLKAPKLHLTDSGLLTHLLGVSGAQLRERPHLLGPVLETFVVMELRKQLGWSEARPTLHHLRTTGGDEIDVVLEDRAGRLAGVEVKASAQVGAADFRGLRTLAERSGDRFVRGVVLHLGLATVPFGPKLMAMPVSSLWNEVLATSGESTTATRDEHCRDGRAQAPGSIPQR